MMNKWREYSFDDPMFKVDIDSISFGRGKGERGVRVERGEEKK